MFQLPGGAEESPAIVGKKARRCNYLSAFNSIAVFLCLQTQASVVLLFARGDLNKCIRLRERGSQCRGRTGARQAVPNAAREMHKGILFVVEREGIKRLTMNWSMTDRHERCILNHLRPGVGPPLQARV